MKVDYLIVGFGLAGLAFSEQLRRNNKTFIIFEDGSQTSSLVAGGMYNPVILKRFTPVWMAREQLDYARPFYAELAERLKDSYDQTIPILRTLKSVEEQNNWFAACDKPLLEDFMSTELQEVGSNLIEAPFKAGKVLKTGRIKVRNLISDLVNEHESEGNIQHESFDHQQLEIEEDQVVYKGIEASVCVFCEGNGLRDNPYFNYLPMTGTKGELLTIHAPDLQLDAVVKSAVFIMPLGNGRFKVGATFNWKDKTNLPTESARQELIEKLESVYKGPYTIIDQEAGVRPTTQDRRPLLGRHPEHQQLALFNGLGTRGVMIAPLLSLSLYNYLEHQQALKKEVDIKRFDPAHH